MAEKYDNRKVKMWLVLVESDLDMVAVKEKTCANCLEKKLETTIIQAWEMSGYEFVKNKKYLKGLKVDCVCDEYRPVTKPKSN